MTNAMRKKTTAKPAMVPMTPPTMGPVLELVSELVSAAVVEGAGSKVFTGVNVGVANELVWVMKFGAKAGTRGV